jgi:uncharacterized repeat protein (TIGR03803 family)
MFPVMQGILPIFVVTIPLFSLLLTAVPASGQTNYTVLKSFSGNPDGAVPYGALVDGKDGAFYGTTAYGGISNYGTVFKVNTDGSSPAILKSFIGPDGNTPVAGLVMSTDGRLFGTTFTGGNSNLGTVFSLKKDGSDFTLLHGFVGGPDGEGPKTALIVGSDEVLYGTTDFTDATNRGTIFKLNKDGTGYSVLHIFTGKPDGQNPTKLLEGSDGNLYGATGHGGLTVVGGTVFSIQKDGSGYAILYGFQAQVADGLVPEAGLVEGSDGALYGTTSRGGSGFGGTVFKLNKDGSGYGILRNFSNTGADAYEPNTELVEGTDGALYGSAYFGIQNGLGASYKLNKDGSGYTVLRNFLGVGGDGESPGPLLLTTNGVFYGTARFGGWGIGGAGCVFALSNLPLPPRVAALSTSGNTNLVECAATSGFQYDLQRSTDLSSWSVLATFMPTNGGVNFSNVNPPQPAGFYRLLQH